MSFKKEIRPFLFVYLFTWIFTFLFFIVSGLLANVSFSDIFESYTAVITTSNGFLTLHIFVFIFYILFLMIRYFIRVYKKRGVKTLFKHFILRLVLPVFIIYFGLKYIIESNANEGFKYDWNYAIENKTDTIQGLYSLDGKHRGMTVYDFGRRNTTNVDELIKNNVEWVVVLPYFYQKDEQTNSIQNTKEVGVWSHRDSMFMESIDQLHDNNIRIHLKPHLWMSSGWRSNINFENNEDWDIWFESYRKTILHFATMAEKTQTELFCIGTELRSSIKAQPEKWKLLIQEIKGIYSGKLTYAANWDDPLDLIDFWNELDYIGVQAYFPLTENTNPELSQIQEGWKRHKEALKSLSDQYQKKILFTEVGYRPDAAATKTPWAWGSAFGPLFKKKSDRTQYLAYEALFEELWNEPWFAGSYVWQWNNSDFEIKGKPAQNSIAKWYGVIVSEEKEK